MSNKNIDFGNNEIVGTIKFGQGCVVHPTCSIIADGGEIIFGNFNIIEEKVIIHNKPVKDANGVVQKKPMIIGDYNLFEMCTRIENSEIGSYNLFEYRCNLDSYAADLSECKVGRGCIVGSDVHLAKKAIPDNQRLFYPSKQKNNDMFDEEKHKEVIIGLYETLATVAPKPRK